MEQITRVLEKINQGRNDQPLTLADFMPLSLAEIRNTGQLSRDDARLLYRAAQKEKQPALYRTGTDPRQSAAAQRNGQSPLSRCNPL